ncbi:MAG TPA: branched-chain amino acid ABC transporter ATP-binding protein/permease [Jiangellaceae bacterium]
MMRRGLIGFPIVALVLAALALFQDSLGVSLFYITVLATLFFWVAQATSWNILSGYSGYFSFGQGAFVGVGVYTTAVLTSKHDWNFYLTLPVAAVLATLVALGIGAVAFRVGAFRGATFALLTLAVPFILASVARLSSRIDGGQGVSVPVPDLPEPLRFQQFLYLVMLVIAIVAVTAAYAIQHSRFGWALAAIRDNEDVAEALGVATFKWKMLAIAVTGAIAGVAGSAWALQFGFVQVEVIFGLTVPLFVIVMSVLGGRTYWVGPVLGAAVIVLVQDRLAGGGFESWRPIIFGGLLAAMVIFAPDGLWARLKARPLLTGVVGGATLLALFIVAVGDVLDRIVLAMLATGVAAFWPQRLLPPQLRRSAPAPLTAPAENVPASATTSPEPAGPEGDAPGNGVTVPRAGQDAPVAIECRGLARHYGGVRALDGLDLQIRQGELVGLIGPNGSGKTTLVNLLSGAVRPTRGNIYVAGRAVTRLAPHAINHAGVARTYQIPRPFESMTLHDNVATAIMFGRKPHGLAEARDRATEYLEFVGLERYSAVRPADINLHQRQLLEMARALATDPKVLFLDESLAGLNPAEIDNAVEVVRRIHSSGVTIVIVEHLLRVVNQLAERVIVLNRGRLLADGDTQTVMRDPAVVDVYLGKSGRTVPANDAGSEHA